MCSHLVALAEEMGGGLKFKHLSSGRLLRRAVKVRILGECWSLFHTFRHFMHCFLVESGSFGLKYSMKSGTLG